MALSVLFCISKCQLLLQLLIVIKVFIFLKTVQLLYQCDGLLTFTDVVNNRFSNCAKHAYEEQ